MSFETFLRAIASPALRDVALHWDAARGGYKQMPARQDIDPTAIAPHLPIVWLWRYDRETDTYRLAFGRHQHHLRQRHPRHPDGRLLCRLAVRSHLRPSKASCRGARTVRLAR